MEAQAQGRWWQSSRLGRGIGFRLARTLPPRASDVHAVQWSSPRCLWEQSAQCPPSVLKLKYIRSVEQQYSVRPDIHSSRPFLRKLSRLNYIRDISLQYTVVNTSQAIRPFVRKRERLDASLQGGR